RPRRAQVAGPSLLHPHHRVRHHRPVRPRSRRGRRHHRPRDRPARSATVRRRPGQSQSPRGRPRRPGPVGPHHHATPVRRVSGHGHPLRVPPRRRRLGPPPHHRGHQPPHLRRPVHTR